VPLIIRIDVDRPYGKRPAVRHLMSRLSSDLYLPKVEAFGYLAELQTMLHWLNEAEARAYAFFRRCTLPSPAVMRLFDAGRHQAGLHLEDSRSYETFCSEIQIMERHFDRKMLAVSKHGSGGAKYGFHHHAPYEPEKYIAWARKASLRLFLGNLEDPTLPAVQSDDLVTYPSAFWLEPHWRDTQRYNVDWLIEQAQRQDIVLLVHPENVLGDPTLITDFKRLIRTVESKVLA